MNLQPIKTSSLILPIKTIQQKEPLIDEEKEFHEARNGRWSGTVVKDLMKCSRKGAALPWNDQDKIMQFSDSIISLLYSKGKQRITGKYIENKGTKEMQYGTRVEPLILSIGSELIKKHFDYEINIKSVKFKSFKDFPNAGATSDAIAEDMQGNVLATVEAKGCTNWNTHYKRTFEKTDDKDMDFWQTQTQMKAWEVEDCYYLVAEPPKDIMKYLYYDGDIMDLKDDFKEECAIHLEIIKESPMHQNAMMKRIIFAESVVEYWIKEGGNLKDVFYGFKDGTMGYAKDELYLSEPKKTMKFPNKYEIKKGTMMFSTNKDIHKTTDLPNDLPF